MKKLSYLFLLLVTIALYPQEVSARIWRINNNTGVVADFTNVQAAINSSSVVNGDTLHVEGSPNTYDNGGVSLNKRLVIIGTGYFLSETAPMVANPNTQANTSPSRLGYYLSLNQGSKGSVISGIIVNGDITVLDSLITVQRCVFNSLIFGYYNANNVSLWGDTIRQNYIVYGLNCPPVSSTCKFKNLIVYNNLILVVGGIAIDFSNNIDNVDGFFINNSIVHPSYGYSYGFSIYCKNIVFQNNIFGDVNFGVYQPFNVYKNNLCEYAGVPSGNSNQQNVNPTTLFNDYLGNGAGYSTDGRFQLKPGCAAIGAGILNSVAVDCGAFGGPAPYILSGMPSIPSIYSLTIPASVNSGTTSMNISFSTASH